MRKRSAVATFSWIFLPNNHKSSSCPLHQLGNGLKKQANKRARGVALHERAPLLVMDKLSVESIPTLAEEQLVADELEMFANSLDAFKRKQDHDKVFLKACAAGNYRDSKKLLQARADVAQCDEDGRTAMHHAAASVSGATSRVVAHRCIFCACVPERVQRLGH